jgi:hypothetical protein
VVGLIEAAIWSCVYIDIAPLFGLVLWLAGKPGTGTAYVTAWLVEKSVSDPNDHVGSNSIRSSRLSLAADAWSPPSCGPLRRIANLTPSEIRNDGRRHHSLAALPVHRGHHGGGSIPLGNPSSTR